VLECALELYKLIKILSNSIPTFNNFILEKDTWIKKLELALNPTELTDLIIWKFLNKIMI
jgi:hypothetical protein